MEQTSRRQILTMGAMIALTAGVAGVPGQRAAASPRGSRPDVSPCVGEPGYEARISRLFKPDDLPVNPSIDSVGASREDER